jgi:hypothetical protein
MGCEKLRRFGRDMDQQPNAPKLDYLTSSPPPWHAPRRRLRFAIASLLVGFMPIMLYIAMLCYAHVRWQTYAEDRMHDRVWRPYHLSAVGVGIQLVGAILGLVSVARREAPAGVAVGVFVLNLVGVLSGLAALWL